MGFCHFLTKASGVLERVKQLASAKGASLCKREASLCERHILRQKRKERKKSHAQERKVLPVEIERLPRRLKTAVNPLLTALSLLSPPPPLPSHNYSSLINDTLY